MVMISSIPIQLFPLRYTSMSIYISDMRVVLQDSGNLVLQGTNEETGENLVLWQGFDYPTDTFLPAMKLGVIHGRTLSLTSWLTDSTPASGSFSLEWDPVGNLLVVRLRERVLWSTGDILSLNPNKMYNLTYISSLDERYLYYTIAASEYNPAVSSKSARLEFHNYGDLEFGGSRLVIFDSRTCAGNCTENGCKRWEGTKVTSTKLGP